MDFKGFINCQPPNKNLYEFSGFLQSDSLPSVPQVLVNDEMGTKSIGLDNKQLVLRGSNLANTKWAIGVVIYTGKETKIMLNSGQARYKQSKVEKYVNWIIVFLMIFQALCCIIMSISSALFTKRRTMFASKYIDYIYYRKLEERADYSFSFGAKLISSYG